MSAPPVAGDHQMHSCIERADMLASRVGRLVDLRRSDRAGRRIGAVVCNFPPNAGKNWGMCDMGPSPRPLGGACTSDSNRWRRRSSRCWLIQPSA